MIICGEICGVIGWAINLVSYHKNNINKLLIMQITASIFFCISYFLLGAYSGLLICFFEMVKMYAHYKFDNDKLIFLCSLPVYALIAFLTCHEPLDFLPVIASIIDAYTVSKNIKFAVSGGFVSYSLWIIYDLSVLAYASALTDLFIVISNLSIIISFIVGFFKSKDVKISEEDDITKTTFERLVKIDIENFGNKFIWPVIYQEAIYLKNKNSFMLISHNSKIIGYINYLVLNKSEYDDILSSKIFDNKVDVKKVKRFSKNAKNYMQIECISVEKEYQNNIIKEKIERKLRKFIRNKIKSGYEISGIICVTCSDFETDLISDIGFEKVHKFDSSVTLFQLNEDKINDIVK